MRFRLAPRSMTLDDLELLYYKREEFRGISQIREPTTVLNEEPVLCQRRRCNRLNVLFNIMFLEFICLRFLRLGPSHTQWCRAFTLALASLSCFVKSLNCDMIIRNTVIQFVSILNDTLCS